MIIGLRISKFVSASLYPSSGVLYLQIIIRIENIILGIQFVEK